MFFLGWMPSSSPGPRWEGAFLDFFPCPSLCLGGRGWSTSSAMETDPCVGRAPLASVAPRSPLLSTSPHSIFRDSLSILAYFFPASVHGAFPGRERSPVRSLLGGTCLSLDVRLVGCLATSSLHWIKGKLQNFKPSGSFFCRCSKDRSDARSSFLHPKLSDFF